MEAEIIETFEPTQPEGPKTYLVPEVNYTSLKEQIARLQRRAKKLNSGAIEIHEIGHEDWPGFYRPRNIDGGDEEIIFLAPGTQAARPANVYRRYFRIAVIGDRPKLNGWQFAATIDAIRDEDNKLVGNMLRVLPGFDVPVEFRKGEMHCDHCNTQRNWNNTFIVRHDDGTFKQVGRRCLKDFTGHKSPEAYAAYAELLLSLDEICGSSEDDDWLGGGRTRGTERYNVKAILDLTACVIRTDGWRPKSFEFNTTASTLQGYVWATNKDREKLEKLYPITDADKQTAQETMDWLVELTEREGLSDYLHNLSLFGLAGAVEAKTFGFLASAIPAYLREKDRLVFAQKEKLVSNYVGEAAKRIETVVTLKLKRYFDSDFGTRTLCKFHDEQGNVVIWWASDSIDLEDGIKVKARFTVKKHEERDEVKQTVVSRLQVREILQYPGSKVELTKKAEDWANLEATRAHRYTGEPVEKHLAEAKQHPEYLAMIDKAEKAIAA